MIANKDKAGATVGADWSIIIMDANPNIDPIWTSERINYYTKSEINDQLAGAAGALQYK